MQGRVFLDRYETVRLLGEGGMGCVFLARDLRGGRPVVIKFMHEHIAFDPKFRERFRRETDLMARLRHPNAVAFLAADEDEKAGPFLVMEYVQGQPLDKLLPRDGRFRPPRLRRLIAQLCDVLEATHAEKIVHCDLKPGNLMVVDFDSPRELLKLMDFGLARLSDGPAPPDPEGADGKPYAVGTPGYMSPEQVRGDPVDARSDLYSVGVILFRLLTGRAPFAGDSPLEILMAQASSDPPTFTDLGLADAIPESIENVVMACLSTDPVHRPQNARELGDAFEEALAMEYSGMCDVAPQPAEDVPAPANVNVKVLSQPLMKTAEPDLVVEQLEAWMPEQVAIYKLQGFADAINGEIRECVPGLVRLRVGKPAPPPVKRSGFFSMFGLGRKPEPPSCEIDIELRLRSRTQERQSVLQLLLLMRPAGPRGAPVSPDFHTRCGEIQRTLRSFLMCGTE